MAGSTALYRYYDDKGVLLYVGISIHPIKRLEEHQKNGEEVWTSDISTVKISRFKTKRKALSEEGRTIRAERPKYNINHGKITCSTRKRKTAFNDHIIVNVSPSSAKAANQALLADNVLYEIDDLVFLHSKNWTEYKRTSKEVKKKNIVSTKRIKLPVNNDIRFKLRSIINNVNKDLFFETVLTMYANNGYKTPTPE